MTHLTRRLRALSAGVLSVAVLSSAAVPAAQASEKGRNTLLGAGAGAAAGGLLGRGNVGGIVAGGLVGGVLGNALTPNRHHYRRSYGYRHQGYRRY